MEKKAKKIIRKEELSLNSSKIKSPKLLKTSGVFAQERKKIHSFITRESFSTESFLNS